MRKPAFRKSFRATLTENQKALDQMADMAGKPRLALYVPEPVKPRAAPGSDGRPLERDVLGAIITYLLHCESVAWIERHNSGTVVDERGQHVKFHQVYRKGTRKVDLDCQLKSGRRMVIEVKRPGWTKPINVREEEQAAYLRMAREAGCLGFFATSVDDVKRGMG